MTAIAGTVDVFDLRNAFAPTVSDAGNAAGEVEDGDEHASTPPPPPAADNEPDGEKLTDEDVKNPKIKKLSDEAAANRVALKAAKQELETLRTFKTEVESVGKAYVEGQMEVAFLRAAWGKVSDPETAWKLANKGGVTITDEGDVEGLDEALTALLDRYPYLAFTEPEQVDDDTKALQERFPALKPTSPSGRQHAGRKTSGDNATLAYLAKRFPALRNRT